jgi:hypothetical protein
MSKNLCPFWKKECIEHDCVMYMRISWVHPQTGLGEDKFACAIPTGVMMQVESARQTRGVQASVDSMRNEVVKRQDVLNAAIEERKHESRHLPAFSHDVPGLHDITPKDG